MESTMTKCNPADPQRCQASNQGEQCKHLSLEGSTFCYHCGGARGQSEVQTYLLTKAKYRDRLAQLNKQSDDEVKSLRNEIALARVLIEERLNAINGETDALAAFGPLQSAFLTVEKLVKSAHQVEQNLGTLLSKSTIIQVGQAISDAIVEELQGIDDYEEKVDNINNRIVEIIAKARNPIEAK